MGARGGGNTGQPGRAGGRVGASGHLARDGGADEPHAGKRKADEHKGQQPLNERHLSGGAFHHDMQRPSAGVARHQRGRLAARQRAQLLQQRGQASVLARRGEAAVRRAHILIQRAGGHHRAQVLHHHLPVRRVLPAAHVLHHLLRTRQRRPPRARPVQPAIELTQERQLLARVLRRRGRLLPQRRQPLPRHPLRPLGQQRHHPGQRQQHLAPPRHIALRLLLHKAVQRRLLPRHLRLACLPRLGLPVALSRHPYPPPHAAAAGRTAQRRGATASRHPPLPRRLVSELAGSMAATGRQRGGTPARRGCQCGGGNDQHRGSPAANSVPWRGARAVSCVGRARL
mmetsp:Transcript_33374/g.84059  ORF Transcript_33374/g.84059 Transcript_33374/m.84059 type:complete len:342 (-) Transcript_33374:162-1187(-)